MKKLIFSLILICLIFNINSLWFSSYGKVFDEKLFLARLLPWTPDLNVWFAERYSCWTKSKYLKYCPGCDKAQHVAVPKQHCLGYKVLFRCWKCGLVSKNQKNLFKKHGYIHPDVAY